MQADLTVRLLSCKVPSMAIQTNGTGGATMRACLYLRKSTEQKTTDERELSTERQKADCIAFIEKQGWIVGPIYTEEDGTSGTIDHDERPELARLLADAKKTPRPFDVLVVW